MDSPAGTAPALSGSQPDVLTFDTTERYTQRDSNSPTGLIRTSAVPTVSAVGECLGQILWLCTSRFASSGRVSEKKKSKCGQGCSVGIGSNLVGYKSDSLRMVRACVCMLGVATIPGVILLGGLRRLRIRWCTCVEGRPSSDLCPHHVHAAFALGRWGLPLCADPRHVLAVLFQ